MLNEPITMTAAIGAHLFVCLEYPYEYEDTICTEIFDNTLHHLLLLLPIFILLHLHIQYNLTSEPQNWAENRDTKLLHKNATAYLFKDIDKRDA